MKHGKKAISLISVSTLLLAGAKPALAVNDTLGPRLSAVTVTEEARDGNDLKYYVELEAADDLSGINHMTVQFKNLDRDRSVAAVMRAEDGVNGVYGGWLTINAYEPDGTFFLYKVTLTDNKGNVQLYCRDSDIDEESDVDKDKLPLPNTATITLSNGIAALDEDAPVLERITAAPKMASEESKITLQAQVTDEGGSGLDYVKARFVNQSGHGITVSLDPEHGMFSGTVSEIQTKYAGIYVLDRVMVKDNAGNRAVYRNGFGVLEQGLQFVITGKNGSTQTDDTDGAQAEADGGAGSGSAEMEPSMTR